LVDDQLQVTGVMYSSESDFYGIGEDSILANNPLRYNLRLGIMLQGNTSRNHALGANYAFWSR
jgi:hypothetical protein